MIPLFPRFPVLGAKSSFPPQLNEIRGWSLPIPDFTKMVLYNLGEQLDTDGKFAADSGVFRKSWLV